MIIYVTCSIGCGCLQSGRQLLLVLILAGALTTAH